MKETASAACYIEPALLSNPFFETKAAGTLKGWPTDSAKGFLQSLMVRGASVSFKCTTAPGQHHSAHPARHLVDSTLKKGFW